MHISKLQMLGGSRKIPLLTEIGNRRGGAIAGKMMSVFGGVVNLRCLQNIQVQVLIRTETVTR